MERISIAYSAPFEEEEQLPSLSWDKQTIEYVIKNKRKIINTINRSIYKKLGNFKSMDTEDIYYDVLEYLNKAGDYSIQRATNSNRKSGIITIEAYVNICINYCAKRYITDYYRRENGIIREVIATDEGTEINIIDSIADNNSGNAFEKVEYDLEECLKAIEYKRYKHGFDIFLLIYLRLLLINENDIKYRKILEVFGLSKNKLKLLEEKIIADEEILEAIKAISIHNRKECIDKLKYMVHGAGNIEKAIKDIR